MTGHSNPHHNPFSGSRSAKEGSGVAQSASKKRSREDDDSAAPGTKRSKSAKNDPSLACFDNQVADLPAQPCAFQVNNGPLMGIQRDGGLTAGLVLRGGRFGPIGFKLQVRRNGITKAWWQVHTSTVREDIWCLQSLVFVNVVDAQSERSINNPRAVEYVSPMHPSRVVCLVASIKGCEEKSWIELSNMSYQPWMKDTFRSLFETRHAFNLRVWFVKPPHPLNLDSGCLRIMEDAIKQRVPSFARWMDPHNVQYTERENKKILLQRLQPEPTRLDTMLEARSANSTAVLEEEMRALKAENAKLRGICLANNYNLDGHQRMRGEAPMEGNVPNEDVGLEEGELQALSTAAEEEMDTEQAFVEDDGEEQAPDFEGTSLGQHGEDTVYERGPTTEMDDEIDQASLVHEDDDPTPMFPNFQPSGDYGAREGLQASQEFVEQGTFDEDDDPTPMFSNFQPSTGDQGEREGLQASQEYGERGVVDDEDTLPPRLPDIGRSEEVKDEETMRDVEDDNDKGITRGDEDFLDPHLE